MPKMRPKFQVGDRVKGNSKAPGDYADREGTVVERGPAQAEYGVQFDDCRTAGAEHLNSWWLDRIG